MLRDATREGGGQHHMATQRELWPILWHHAYIIPYPWEVGMCPKTQHPRLGGKGGGALRAAKSPLFACASGLYVSIGHWLPAAIFVRTYLPAWRIRMTIMGSMGTEGV